MEYLIFDFDGELIDVLHFESDKSVAEYKAANLNYVVLSAEDTILNEDGIFVSEDDEDLEE
jgi:hypothetical protein